MVTYETVAEVREASRLARRAGKRVGVVPTMGFLHEGHLALVRRARELADWVVVTVFINPTQFGPTEDLARYPRDLPRDLELCREAGADAVFAPGVEELYPPGCQTAVEVGALAEPLCGARRPGHFRGVATVVAKLFAIVEPDVAVFGEKDYQQLQVVRRMAEDLCFGVAVVGYPTVRDADGLALSSRNAYLAPADRDQALSLSRALAEAEALVARGEDRPGAIEGLARERLTRAGVRVDYAEVRHPETLERVERIRPRVVLALAGFVGATRLIDNRVLTAPAA